MTTYVLLADVNEEEFQNPQELSSVWGELQTDIEQHGGELTAAYALLGQYDFLLLVDVDDPEAALKVSLAVERHGVDVRTMEAFSIDQLADIVEDV